MDGRLQSCAQCGKCIENVFAMTANEFETLRNELRGLRAEIDRHFVAIKVRFAKIEAQLDTKPSLAALYQAVATLAFGIGAVVTSTIVVLKNIGLMG
jgi:hypothetical protein